MDQATHTYKSRFRLYRDRPDILVPGRWYWCPPGAVAIPFFHRFLSYRLDDFTHEESGSDPRESPEVGEFSHWDGPSVVQANPRYTGQHWCGPEEYWTQGVPYALRGTQILDWEGVPLCCITTPLRPGGGLAQGKARVINNRTVGSQANQVETAESTFSGSTDYEYLSTGVQVETGQSTFVKVVPITADYFAPAYFAPTYFAPTYFG